MDVVSAHLESIEKFRRDEVHLSEVGTPGPTSGNIPMPDVWARVSVALDSVALHQCDATLRRFAEMMPPVSCHRQHRSLEYEIVNRCLRAMKGGSFTRARP